MTIINAWLAKRERAEQKWGRFGAKHSWMFEHPDATQADWEAHDAARYERWKKKHPQ